MYAHAHSLFSSSRVRNGAGRLSVVVGFAVLGSLGSASASEWHDVSVPDSPPARQDHAMAYDADREQVVLFGGRQALTQSAFADTWVWDGTDWTLAATSGPPGRYHAAMAYDPARGVTVLYGGQGNNGLVLGDAWEWDGTTWTQIPDGPGRRYGHSMAASPGQTLVMGGQTSSLGSDLCDVGTDDDLHCQGAWGWDGISWQLVDNWPQTCADPNEVTIQPWPCKRMHGNLVYDGHRDRFVYSGGFYILHQYFIDTTWEWDGASWTQTIGQAFPPGPLAEGGSPTGNTDQAMTFDEGESLAVLYDGVPNHRGTWSYDGSHWLKQGFFPVEPGPRHGTAMAYDSARDVHVLFGGVFDDVGLDDTWELEVCDIRLTLLSDQVTVLPGGLFLVLFKVDNECLDTWALDKAELFLEGLEFFFSKDLHDDLFVVRPGESREVRYEYRVPERMEPGEYRATVALSRDGLRVTAASFDLTVGE